jgi:hypothetical protein
MTTLVFPKSRDDIGHAEFNDHHEDDLAALHKKVPPPKMRISNKWKYFFWAGTPKDPDGSISWLALLRAVTRETVLGWFFFTIMGTAAGYLAAVGGTTIPAFAFATLLAMMTIGFMTYRHTRMLPTQLNYALTFAEMPHFRIGPFMQLWYLLAGVVSALLAWVTIVGLVAVPVGPDWTTGAAGAFSTGGAFVYYVLAGFLFVFAFQHNQTLDLHTYYSKGEGTNLLNFVRLAFQVGSVAYAIGFIGWFTGMWDVNPFLNIATCLAAGTCNTPITGAWLVRFFGPIIGGLSAWVAQLWTWNQNSIPRSVLRDAARQQAAAQYGLYDRPDTGISKKKVDNM